MSGVANLTLSPPPRRTREHIVLVDDTMHLASMRRSVYRLARDGQWGDKQDLAAALRFLFPTLASGRITTAG